jgi:hypothetical protein
MLRIDEHLARPKPLRDLSPRHQLSLPRRKQYQQFERLPFHTHRPPIELKLKSLAVQPEIPELVHEAGHISLAEFSD